MISWTFSQFWLGVKAAEMVLDVERIMEFTKYGLPHEPLRDRAFHSSLLSISSVLGFTVLEIMMVVCKKNLCEPAADAVIRQCGDSLSPEMAVYR